jgi:tetratricopeptide (TPR) repeat protein
MISVKQRITEADQLYGQALTKLQIGDPAGAVRLLDEITTRFPEYAKAWFEIAGILMSQLGDPEAATEYFRKAIETDPSFAPAYLGYAEALFTLGRFPEVNAILNQAMELKVVRKDIALCRRAMLLESQGRFDESTDTYRNAIMASFSLEEIRKCEEGIERCIIKRKHSR